MTYVTIDVEFLLFDYEHSVGQRIGRVEVSSLSHFCLLAFSEVVRIVSKVTLKKFQYKTLMSKKNIANVLKNRKN